MTTWITEKLKVLLLSPEYRCYVGAPMINRAQVLNNVRNGTAYRTELLVPSRAAQPKAQNDTHQSPVRRNRKVMYTRITHVDEHKATHIHKSDVH